MMMLLILIILCRCFWVLSTAVLSPSPSGINCDFESNCSWTWNRSFTILSGKEANTTFHERSPGNITCPFFDANNNTNGHFLYLYIAKGMDDMYGVWSPWFMESGYRCRIQMALHMMNMKEGNIKVVVETFYNQSWVIVEKQGNDLNSWDQLNTNIGRLSRKFRVMLEVVPGKKRPAHVAIDNIRLISCFPEEPPMNACTPNQFKCSNGICIDRNKVCDFTKDCSDGEDEGDKCVELDQKYPAARCTFEDGWCGWRNIPVARLNWTMNSGPTEIDYTGPSVDHTYGNNTGKYVFVDMPSTSVMGDEAILESARFRAPPTYHGNNSSEYYNSCQIRFYHHKFGYTSSSLELQLVELSPKFPKGRKIEKIWYDFGARGDYWIRESVALPPDITHDYHIRFAGIKGISFKFEMALDDIALAPECFGIGVPPPWTYPSPEIETPPVPVPSFENITGYTFGTCGAEGRLGPEPGKCHESYKGKNFNVTVLTQKKYEGIQMWTVPESGWYTIIAKGAAGGKGRESFLGTSTGALVRTVIELQEGERLYMLIGQKGKSPCWDNEEDYKNNCRETFDGPFKGTIIDLDKENLLGGGGGGGGGTYVFRFDKFSRPVPLVVAGGGGGLGYSLGNDRSLQNGKKLNKSLSWTSGRSENEERAGAGGGWNDTTPYRVQGQSLLEGGHGGFGCNGSSRPVDGGFGGGGGGCSAGGGGGGYTGGNAWSGVNATGEGGYSYYHEGFMTFAQEAANDGPGAVHVIPAIEDCGCDFRCVALNEWRSEVLCLCPREWFLGEDGVTCHLLGETDDVSLTSIIILVVVGIMLATFIGGLCMFLYNRYQRKKVAISGRKTISGADLQLSRLRIESHGMMTEYNPNYEFGGGTYTIQDLKEIPRDNLRLVKALGQGAFGEVYQGFFRNRAGDAVEMPVAVKTLPELSSNQAEMDFLMEALIMSKFSHPNIVHFIGVCFDKHPRFIVLELLAGGDLKTFLRESRPKPDRPSPLTMKDLLMCSMDVAKGCKYMEDNHFIHRDIAARNCLLTTKGPGRVVKIADFGMARDIYRADYYRKGGKAMLPVKWMPPEAFLDGIFTSKTDVWSFGVLLWEVMSLGYMPYTGRGNQEVMQLVTNGGRLEPPSNCPGPVYGIMTQCWHPIPDDRPNFGTIIERLGYCMQDPDVMNSPLPVFYRPPSAERDATIMRPPAHENSCLQVQRPSDGEPQSPASADYLIPVPCNLADKVELQSSPSAGSVDKLLGASNWETSFVRSPRNRGGYTSVPTYDSTLPESKSTQPLLETSPTDSPSRKTDSPNGGIVNMAANRSPPSDTHTKTSNISSSTSSNVSNNKNEDDLAAAVGSLISLENGNDHQPECLVDGIPPNVNNNNNNPTGANKTGLKGSLSLDASALSKQHATGQPVPYVNVSVTSSHLPLSRASSQEPPQGQQQQPVHARSSAPYTVHNANRPLLADNEISC